MTRTQTHGSSGHEDTGDSGCVSISRVPGVGVQCERKGVQACEEATTCSLQISHKWQPIREAHVQATCLDGRILLVHFSVGYVYLVPVSLLQGL